MGLLPFYSFSAGIDFRYKNRMPVDIYRYKIQKSSHRAGKRDFVKGDCFQKRMWVNLGMWVGQILTSKVINPIERANGDAFANSPEFFCSNLVTHFRIQQKGHDIWRNNHRWSLNKAPGTSESPRVCFYYHDITGAVIMTSLELSS